VSPDSGERVARGAATLFLEAMLSTLAEVAPVIGAEAALNVADFLVAGIGADGADILRGVATMHGEV